MNLIENKHSGTYKIKGLAYIGMESFFVHPSWLSSWHKPSADFKFES